ncbi:MAG: hypothetical protein ACK559_29635, partial [bacterium]
GGRVAEGEQAGRGPFGEKPGPVARGRAEGGPRGEVFEEHRGAGPAQGGPQQRGGVVGVRRAPDREAGVREAGGDGRHLAPGQQHPHHEGARELAAEQRAGLGELRQGAEQRGGPRQLDHRGAAREREADAHADEGAVRRGEQVQPAGGVDPAGGGREAEGLPEEVQAGIGLQGLPQRVADRVGRGAQWGSTRGAAERPPAMSARRRAGASRAVRPPRCRS